MSTELNNNQLLAVQMLASGMNGRDIAKELKVRPETLSRWKAEPEFEAAVNYIVVGAQEATRAKLSQLSEQALQVIEDVLNDSEAQASTKLSAAFKVLDRVGTPERTLETNAEKIKSAQKMELIFL
jgi:transposase